MLGRKIATVGLLAAGSIGTMVYGHEEQRECFDELMAEHHVETVSEYETDTYPCISLYNTAGYIGVIGTSAAGAYIIGAEVVARREDAEEMHDLEEVSSSI